MSEVLNDRFMPFSRVPRLCLSPSALSVEVVARRFLGSLLVPAPFLIPVSVFLSIRHVASRRVPMGAFHQWGTMFEPGANLAWKPPIPRQA